MTDSLFIVGNERTFGKRLAPLRPKILRSKDEVREAFELRAKRAFWIAPTASSLRHLASLNGARSGDHRLLLLTTVDRARFESLRALFHYVVARDPSSTLLPSDEIAEVMASPQRDDRFIGGTVNLTNGTLVLYRGNLEPLVVPLAWFARSGAPQADLADFEVTDFGQTVRFGDFEASADAILYEFDREARQRAKKRRIANDKSFGGALRRIRLQRGLGQSSFKGISAKEIGRIERGTVVKPHADTLARIAERLGVAPEDIETY